MVTRAHTVAFLGVEARPVEVQCALSPGLPAFNMVGLPDKAVSESKERVRAAMSAVGLAMPPQRITINLSQGALPAALDAAGRGMGLICPAACDAEAAWVGEAEVLAPASLLQLVNHFAGRTALSPPEPGPVRPRRTSANLVDVKGQEGARRALEVAAAGNHHILMIGEPGSGKSMLAARMTSIMPPLTPAEALEVSTICSLAGDAAGAAHGDGALCRERPYRAPHHSASMAAMIGGGRRAQPGEVSLAHRGVLFLDELPEFARPVLEALRQPIETGEVTVARAEAHVRYPARFLLVAAMNPCRCGYLTDAGRACSRAPRCGADYQARISGPLIDRFDMRIEMPPVTAETLGLPAHGDSSERVGARVAGARAAQVERANGTGPASNGELEGEFLERVATPDEPGRQILVKATEKLRLSARGYHRVLRLSRTLADLDGKDAVGRPHVAEAVGYRRAMG